MPAQRTGGRKGIKVHLLDPKDSEHTLCNRRSFDVAYSLCHDYITCTVCLREWQHRLHELRIAMESSHSR